jgi:hypothetical protein
LEELNDAIVLRYDLIERQDACHIGWKAVVSDRFRRHSLVNIVSGALFNVHIGCGTAGHPSVRILFTVHTIRQGDVEVSVLRSDHRRFGHQR